MEGPGMNCRRFRSADTGVRRATRSGPEEGGRRCLRAYRRQNLRLWMRSDFSRWTRSARSFCIRANSSFCFCTCIWSRSLRSAARNARSCSSRRCRASSREKRSRRSLARKVAVRGRMEVVMVCIKEDVDVVVLGGPERCARTVSRGEDDPP